MTEENTLDSQTAEIEALAAQAENEDFTPEPEALQGEYQSAQPEQQQISTGELCTTLLHIGFALVAARRGDHWKLSAQEAAGTGEAVGAVLDKYFPDMPAHGAEIVAVIAVGSVLAPRLAVDSQISKEKPKQAPKNPEQKDAKEDAPVFTMEGYEHGD